MRRVHLFILGADYHLGDLLWLTAVIRDLREKLAPSKVIVSLPNAAMGRILEGNPLIDAVCARDRPTNRGRLEDRFGGDVVIHDLRVGPLALAMVRQWRRRLPWLYYRDLWLRPRGQWLATFLGLGELRSFRPGLVLTEEDRSVARELPRPYVLFAPRIGHYSIPLLGLLWRRLKGWPEERWSRLAAELGRQGYEVFSLGAAGQPPVCGTRPLTGLPIRQVAGVVEGAAALVTVESGLWFVAAALDVPFIIVRWWLPWKVDWPGAMQVPHARIHRGSDSVSQVLSCLNGLLADGR